MVHSTVIDDLARYGPGVTGRAATLEEGRAYCRRLATSHYENFTVASVLVPRKMRPHFHAIYAYCRWADDLADEMDSPKASRGLLEWWETQLEACYAGSVTHPVFVALAPTINEFSIPKQPFLDLLTAFRRDQQQTRYATFGELREYCRCSADPVGGLVLHLARTTDAESLALSDRICTGLQLANFLQDVAVDWDRGRVYLPQEMLLAAGYDESMFVARSCNNAFRDVMANEVARAEEWLRAGMPLADRVPREFQTPIELFARGGLAILAAIRRVNYDVWRRRPNVSRREKFALLLGAWFRRRFRRCFRRGDTMPNATAIARVGD